MADRQTKVHLSVQMQQYVDGMNKAAKATRDTVTEAKSLTQMKQDFDRLGRASLAAGGLIAAGLGVAIGKFAEFDQQMSNVQAATHETTENMELLRDAALEAGASTVYSATEAASAVEELAKAGLQTTDILNGGLTGALDLAAASGLGVAQAAEIAAKTMNQFALEGTQTQHVADLLAAGAGKATGDVSDLGMALAQVGQVANGVGLTVEETTAALAAFASQGLLGSDAGTSFKTMLLQLTPTTKKAAELMDELNLSAYDQQGAFIGLEAYAGKLESALGGMSAEQQTATLKTIYGNDAYRAANVLLQEGAEGVAEWTAKVDDAGYASETAATRLDNLRGDWEALTGALDTALISMGEAADGPLRGLVQGLTGLIDKFNEMPDAGKQAVFWIGALGSAGAIALGSYLLLVPKIAQFNAALELLGPNAQKASKHVGNFAKVAGGAAAAVAIAIPVADALTEAFAAMGDSAELTGNKVKTASTAIQLMDVGNAALIASNFGLAAEQVERLGDVLDGVGADGSGGIVSATTLTSIQQLGSELGDLAYEDLPAAQEQFALLAKGAGLTEEQQAKLLDQMGDYKKALTDQATGTDTAATSQELLALALGTSESSTEDNEDALRSLAGQAAETGNEVEDLADQIRNFGSATIGVKEAQAGLEQSLDDLTASVATNGATLDLTEQAGRDNQAALIDLAEASKDLAAATYEQTGSQEDANDVIEEGRSRLIEMLTQLGLTGDEAEAYADDLGLIPENIDTAVSLDTSNASSTLDAFIREYSGKTITLELTTNQVEVDGRVYGGLRDGRATGGAIYGPGSGTSDEAGLYPLSNGEHVLTAADVAAMGGQHKVYAMRESLHGGGGGSVGSAVSINQVIQPAPGMSEEQIARIAAEKTAFALRRN